MGLYFGTDGLRGVVNEELTFDIAYKVGNAIASIADAPRVIVGRDTRTTGEYLTVGLAGGVMSGGGSVTDLGVIPTSGVAYLARELSADFGVVISASHNSTEYNGIKVFDKRGYKLSDREEERLERCFIRHRIGDFSQIGHFKVAPECCVRYEDFLVRAAKNSLKGLTVALDCANGAAYRIAPSVFGRLGASVVATADSDDGMHINDGCGALYPENLARRMGGLRADIGFSFDGDADRLIAVSPDGRVIDGDAVLYMLALHLKREGRLRESSVVGTSHTNMAVERALASEGISLLRTDIGDKYVLARLVERGLSLGGEQSGHIILRDMHTTGDGILTAVVLSDMLISSGGDFSVLDGLKLYPQTNLGVTVEDKMRIMNSQTLAAELARVTSALDGIGRVLLRASGTEPKIRIMVESEDADLNERYASELKAVVLACDKGG